MLFVTFGLFVIRHPFEDTLFALVNEGQKGWWLPGGGVDGHETFLEGARREAIEEAHAEVNDDVKLLQIEIGYQRLRYIVTGRAKTRELKSVPDKESMGASWMTLEETKRINRGTHNIANSRLRGPEPIIWFKYLLNGGTGYDIAPFIEARVEPGAKGMDYEGRAVFDAKMSCVIACKQGEEYLLDALSDTPRLPCFTPRIELGETMQECAERGLREMGFSNIEAKGVLKVRDVRNRDNTMDFRVAFLVEAQNDSSSSRTASPDELNDDFDVQVVNNAEKSLMLPLDALGEE